MEKKRTMQIGPTKRNQITSADSFGLAGVALWLGGSVS
jgi:hypothetical protein